MSLFLKIILSVLLVSVLVIPAQVMANDGESEIYFPQVLNGDSPELGDLKSAAVDSNKTHLYLPLVKDENYDNTEEVSGEEWVSEVCTNILPWEECTDPHNVMRFGFSESHYKKCGAVQFELNRLGIQYYTLSSGHWKTYDGTPNVYQLARRDWYPLRYTFFVSWGRLLDPGNYKTECSW